MWSTALRKFSAVIPSSRPGLRNERGQSVVEYMLVLIVVIGGVFILAKPVFGNLQKKIQDSFKEGFFKEDTTGEKYYYYPLN